jgi:hypothetical protein
MSKLFSDESKEQCKNAIAQLKFHLAAHEPAKNFSVEDNEKLATSLMTLDFFINEQPFDFLTINRMDGELGLCYRIMNSYRRAA